MTDQNEQTQPEASQEYVHEYISNDENNLFYGCPRYVHVGSLRIELQVMGADTAMLGGLLGMAQPDHARIILAEHVHPHVLANTAIHEVIHCINRNRNITGHQDEEHITDQIATGLCDFRVLNPEFFSWWEALLHA